MKDLIDTDWIVDYLKGKQPTVQLLDTVAHEGAAISLISYGEIYEGIYFGKDRDRHEQGLAGLLQIVDVLPLNQPILEKFARIRGTLRAQGQLIGNLDLLIAATALHHDLILVTRNLNHFRRISNLKLYQST
jgi:predicted nucleic acid-binding protein